MMSVVCTVAIAIPPSSSSSSSSIRLFPATDRLHPSSYRLSHTDWLRRYARTTGGFTWCKSMAACCHVFTCVTRITRLAAGGDWILSVCVSRKLHRKYWCECGWRCEPHTHEPNHHSARSRLRRRRPRRCRCKANLSDSSNSWTRVRACAYTCQTDWQHPFPLLRRPETPGRRELFVFFSVFISVCIFVFFYLILFRLSVFGRITTPFPHTIK